MLLHQLLTNYLPIIASISVYIYFAGIVGPRRQSIMAINRILFLIAFILFLFYFTFFREKNFMFIFGLVRR